MYLLLEDYKNLSVDKINNFVKDVTKELLDATDMVF
jgi:hypothetical protein